MNDEDIELCSSFGQERCVRGDGLAFERDKSRTTILQKMVRLASADTFVTVKAASDFLAAKPDSTEYQNVGAILLDPSCSGSGIVGRDDAVGGV